MGDSPRTVVVHGSGGVFGWLAVLVCTSDPAPTAHLSTALYWSCNRAVLASGAEAGPGASFFFTSFWFELFFIPAAELRSKNGVVWFQRSTRRRDSRLYWMAFAVSLFFILICIFKSFVRAWSEAYCMRTLLRLEDSYVCVCVRVRECVLARKRVLLRLIRIQKIAKEDANLMILPFCAL